MNTIFRSYEESNQACEENKLVHNLFESPIGFLALEGCELGIHKIEWTDLSLFNKKDEKALTAHHSVQICLNWLDAYFKGCWKLLDGTSII